MEVAQYACDFCRHRKIRCSREKPKCKACLSWSGPCIYSRRGRISRRPRANISSKSPEGLGKDIPTPPSDSSEKSPPDIFESPTTPDSTARSDNDELNSFFNRSIVEQLEDRIGIDRLIALKNSGKATTLHDENLSEASFLNQANRSIKIASISSSSAIEPDLRNNVENKLSELTHTFEQLTFDDSDVFTNVRNFRRTREVFFIPEKDEGEEMISLFMEHIKKGNPLLVSPPTEVVRKILFEPNTVSERAWILLINAFLSTSYACLEPPMPANSKIARGLQWNTWTILQDSSIFLEASEITIQALLIVTCHGQEITPPSLCWNLISHACRMAQIINLHVPSRKYAPDSLENGRRSCIFWCLFIIDKSFSLAFGRPPSLPYHFYDDVKPPHPSILAMIRPHQGSPNLTLKTMDRTQQFSNQFGAIHFELGRDLAVIQGKILDATSFRGSFIKSNLPVLGMKKQLDGWKRQLDKIISIYSNLEGITSEITSMLLGLDSLNFHYHHLMVYLTRSREHHDLCLTSARAAIEVMDKLVSNSFEVFNGIVWQLLYYPFLPYFVIFSNIITSPKSPSCFNDLELLRKVVIYFLRMDTNHKSAGKLEQIAETFTQLAESYVRNARRTPNNNNTTEDRSSPFDPQQREEVLSKRELTGGREKVFTNADQFGVNLGSERNPTATIASDFMPMAIDLADELSDPLLLNFLSYSDPRNSFDNGLAAVPTPESSSPWGYQAADKAWDGVDSETGVGLDSSASMASGMGGEGSSVDSSRGLGMRLQSPLPVFDGNFDWFSWESYALGEGMNEWMSE